MSRRNYIAAAVLGASLVVAGMVGSILLQQGGILYCQGVSGEKSPISVVSTGSGTNCNGQIVDSAGKPVNVGS